jgi:hypothetical protein
MLKMQKSLFDKMLKMQKSIFQNVKNAEISICQNVKNAEIYFSKSKSFRRGHGEPGFPVWVPRK